MPPRYAYWTILAGGLPTSFRAASRDDLLPTLRRLQERHPDAEMKWFARGKLWASPEAAVREPRQTTAPRGRDWRPGGDHKDPREKYKTAKLARNVTRRKQRFTRKNEGDAGAFSPRGVPAARPRKPLGGPSNPATPAPAHRSSGPRSRPPGQRTPWSRDNDRPDTRRPPDKERSGPGRGPEGSRRRAPNGPPKGGRRR